MRCSKCGRNILPGEKFCETCGTPVTSQVQEKSSSNVFLILGIVGGMILVGIIAVLVFFMLKGGDSKEDVEIAPVITPTVTDIPEETPEVAVEVIAEETPIITEIPEPIQESNNHIYPTLYVVNCKQDITLRTSPSTKASAICKIPLGSPVSYVETSSNGFYKIIYLGKTGYALASYLDTSYHNTPSVVTQAPNPQPQQETYTASVAPQAYETLYVENCQTSITLRKTPSTKASEICQIPLGAAVSYVEWANADFYKIVYNGHVGYALSSYLTDVYGVPSIWQGMTMYVVNCNESITLRTSPSSNASEICQIPKNASVEFCAYAGDGFYRVAYGGYEGYALASYLN